MGANFPDRVRKALQHPAASEHPSADLLNAYAEHTLGPTESQQVMEHLATCAGCRDVVYLACGAMEIAEEQERVVASVTPFPKAAAATVPEPRRRLHWWTYAVPILGLLVVGSVLLVEPFRARRHHMELAKATQQHSQALQNQGPQNALQEQPLQNQVQSAPAPSPNTETKNPILAVAPPRAKPRDVTPAKSAEAAKVAQSDFSKQESKRSDEISQASSGRQSYQNVPAAPASSQKDSLDKKLSGPASGVASPAVPTETTETANLGARKEMAGDATGSVHARAMAMAPVSRVSSTAGWRITRGGSLEHLVADAWIPVAAAPGGPFLSVTNFGKEVWAAGNNLALYHSGDEGLHWERLKLPQEMSGEIVQVTFTSALDGTLATSTGQLWASHDGGKTWSAK